MVRSAKLLNADAEAVLNFRAPSPDRRADTAPTRAGGRAC